MFWKTKVIFASFSLKKDVFYLYYNINSYFNIRAFVEPIVRAYPLDMFDNIVTIAGCYSATATIVYCLC